MSTYGVTSFTLRESDIDSKFNIHCSFNFINIDINDLNSILTVYKALNKIAYKSEIDIKKIIMEKY